MSVLAARDVTEQIIGAAYEVYNVLGYGFLEVVYKQAMLVELRRRGIQAEIEQSIKVTYKGYIVGEFKADLVVEKCVLVELKIAKEYVIADEAQLLNELKAGSIRIGLLINFGKLKVEFKRMVY
jgi:GxxExxY protein